MSPMAQEVSFAAGVMYLESLQTEEMWVWILPQSLSNLLTLKKWINISSLRFYSYQVKIKPIYLVGLLWEKKKMRKVCKASFQCLEVYIVCVSVAQSCLPICDPMDCPSGSSVHGILQARILEWIAIPFSRGTSQPRDRTQVCITGRSFTVWATGKSYSTCLINGPAIIIEVNLSIDMTLSKKSKFFLWNTCHPFYILCQFISVL